MFRVVCVLKTGGVYTPEHVHALRTQVQVNLPIEHEFVCLSDHPQMEYATPLTQSLQGWWSKVELCRPGIVQDRALFLDLDVVITGDLTELCTYRGKFCIARDFYHKRRVNSSLIALNEETADNLWREYLARIDQIQAYQAKWQKHWDQKLFYGEPTVMANAKIGTMDLFQDLYPDQVVSFKADLDKDWRQLTPQNRVVVFHGKPKPWECPPPPCLTPARTIEDKGD